MSTASLTLGKYWNENTRSSDKKDYNPGKRFLHRENIIYNIYVEEIGISHTVEALLATAKVNNDYLIK